MLPSQGRGRRFESGSPLKVDPPAGRQRSEFDSRIQLMNHAIKLLTKGLLSGYAGGSTIYPVQRANFVGKKSHIEFSEGIYHDEWFAEEMGGGQELVQVGSESFTRVYAGGAVKKDILDGLGITSGEIVQFLIKRVSALAEKTRLFTSHEDTKEQDWCYIYTIIDANSSIPITVGKEEIRYKQTVVFIHWFILCPVK